MVRVQGNLGQTVDAIGGRSSGHDELRGRNSRVVYFAFGE
jgi:hypothetical protein